MTLPLHISWKDSSGSNVYKGADWANDSWLRRDLPIGVLQPDSYSEVFTVVMENPVQQRRLETTHTDGLQPSGTPEKFINVRLYLDSDDASVVDMLVYDWPGRDAGVELSFDQGVSWKRISALWGNPVDETTWIPLPPVVSGAPDGELGAFPPYNRALILARIKTPANPASFGLFRFELAVDCDVL